MKVPIPSHPKRKLGQNFLHDQNIIEKILHFLEPSPSDVVLEIGAGAGALTASLAPLVSKLVAVEVDESLLPYLGRIGGIEILHADIRRVDLSGVAAGKKLRVVGNLPYYISSTILNSLILQRDSIQDMVLMFQKEVAQRILAPPSHPEYGFLSVVAQYFCEIDKGFRISRHCFTPKPDIESRILRFRFREPTVIDYEGFTTFVGHAFSQRRKKIRNNLLRTLSINPERLDAIFDQMKIPQTSRAENLSPSQFEQLILQIQDATTQ